MNTISNCLPDKELTILCSALLILESLSKVNSMNES
jgi:hypothetical protein